MRRMKLEAGFTLMEIAVATALVAAIGVPILASYTSANKITQTKYHTAANVARQEVEKVFEAVRQDWWAIASKPLSLSSPTQPPASVIDGKTFTVTSQVNSGSGTPIDLNADGKDDYRRVRMRVTWT